MSNKETLSKSQKPKNKRMVKIVGIVSGIVAVIVVAGVIFIYTYTYTVSGKVTDISTGQAVKDVKVAVAGHTQTTDDQGEYKISDIKIFEKPPMIITPPSQFMKHDNIKLDYKYLKTNNDFTVEPTLIEIVGKTNTAGINGQYDYLWDLMHPDDRTNWGSKTEYKDLLSKRDVIYSNNSYTVKSIDISQNIRQLTTWKSPITGKEYNDVMEVPLKYTMVDNGKEQPDNTLKYFKKVNGFYHYFTTVDKSELIKWLDQYSK